METTDNEELTRPEAQRLTPWSNQRRFRYFQSLERVQFRIVDTFSAGAGARFQF